MLKKNKYSYRVYFMKRTLIFLAIISVMGCGPAAIDVRTSFEQAQTSYERLLTLHPEAVDTQGYRIYMAKARSARKRGSYTSAENFAGEARDQAKRAYTVLKRLKDTIKNHLETTRAKMDNLLVPSQYAVHQYFAALDAYKSNEYRRAENLLDEASGKLAIDAQTAFTKSVTLKVPDNLKYRFGSSIPVFSFLGNDFRLHKQIRSIKGPVRVDFVGQFFLNESFSYFHIRSNKLTIDGWVYPQFVIKGKIKEVK